MSRSAEREISSALFFLITFSFAPIWSKEKVAKEFRLFKGGRFVNRPYGQILNCINRSRRIKKHCSWDVQRTFLRAPSCRAGACSRRFGSMKSVCNGGTKAPPYNTPLTHLRWELPPRGAFRKKLPRRENAIIHNRLCVTLSGAGIFANAGRGRRPRRSFL